MIELILIAVIIAEILLALWLIGKISLYTQHTESINKNIEQNEYQNIFRVLRIEITTFNKRLTAEKKVQEEKINTHLFRQIINAVIFLFSAYKWLTRKKKPLFVKKHK